VYHPAWPWRLHGATRCRPDVVLDHTVSLRRARKPLARTRPRKSARTRRIGDMSGSDDGKAPGACAKRPKSAAKQEPQCSSFSRSFFSEMAGFAHEDRQARSAPSLHRPDVDVRSLSDTDWKALYRACSTYRAVVARQTRTIPGFSPIAPLRRVKPHRGMSEPGIPTMPTHGDGRRTRGRRPVDKTILTAAAVGTPTRRGHRDLQSRSSTPSRFVLCGDTLSPACTG